jgi:hypothetical protein
MSNQSSSRERRRQTFKDLAILANAPEPPSPSAPAESSGRFDLSALREPAEETVAGSRLPGSPPPDAPAATPAAHGSSSKRGLVALAVGLLVFLVTGSVLSLRARARTEPAAVAAMPGPGIVAPPTLPPAAHEREVGRPEGVTTSAVSFATLPTAPSAPPPRATKGSVNNARKRDPESKPVLKEKTGAASEKLELGEAIENAVGARAEEPAAATVRSHEGATPAGAAETPATGELRAALGVALPAARACLGPDDAISRAEVVFGSSGAVKAVHVKGEAAGRPAEACIVAALGKARVGPFRREPYVTIVTVRAPGDP